MTPLRAALPDLRAVFARIAEAAPARDAENGPGLAEEVAWLHEAGALVGALTQALTGRVGWSDEPLAVADILRGLGRASLPVGRLFEGHVNAVQLVGLYGSASLKSRCAASVEAGGMLGVWGADGAAPVRAEAAAGGFRLTGGKSFCSGLGVVRTALVSAALDGNTHLFAVDVDDPDRSDHAQWRVSGMRATRSGAYDFTDVEVAADAAVGGPNEYFVEPYFLGGMYRICAVQAGGLEALLDELSVALRGRGKASAALAQSRVGDVACSAQMAAAVTGRAAQMVASEADPRVVAREAILAREGVERCAVDALQVVERSLGTQCHREDSRISMLRRDLSFYLRQAAVDERLSSVGADLLAGASKS